MNIVYCSAEVAPFSKTGGLGDVSWAIPKGIKELGVQIVVFTPLYKFIEVTKNEFELIAENLKVYIGEEVEYFDLYRSNLPNSDVIVYFIAHPYLYRDGIYVDNDGEEYADSAMRFLFFNKSIFEALKRINYSPDIFHLNDWHTSFVPFYLKTEYKKEHLFEKSKCVFTIHNLGYQGIYPRESIQEAKIPSIYFNDDFFGFHGKVNFMKGGIVYSDILTTVSQQYAREIQTEEYGFGLESWIHQKKESLYGIVHGIDYLIWDPKVDSLINANYSYKSLEGKKSCKQFLQMELGLENFDGPLIAVISRLAYQKGLDFILERFDDIMNLGIQFVLLGTGDKEFELAFKQKEKEHEGNCSINIKFDNELAHRIEAGADMFLMPSKYEPCGLNQMYSMVYGTIPIVRRTGGLVDTVKDYNQQTGDGTGFVFEKDDPYDFLFSIKRAVNIFKFHQDKWIKLMKNAMQEDFTWKKSAKEWLKVYKIAINS